MNNPNWARELLPAVLCFGFIASCMTAGGYGVPILNEIFDLKLENPTGSGVVGGTFVGIFGAILGLRTLGR